LGQRASLLPAACDRSGSVGCSLRLRGGSLNEVTLALLLSLATNMGALIYFAGAIQQAISDHDRRITSVESDVKVVVSDVATLKSKDAASQIPSPNQ